MRIPKRPPCCLIAISLTALPFSGSGQEAVDLKGAGAFLDAIEPVEASLAPPEEGEAPEGGKELVRDLQTRWDALIDRADGTTEAEWLALFELYVQAMDQTTRLDWAIWKNESSRQYDLTDELPAPPAWPAISEALIAHSEAPDVAEPDAGARTLAGVLGQFLAGNRATFLANWEAVYEMSQAEEVDEEDYTAQQVQQLYDQLDTQIREMLSLGDGKAAGFAKVLTRWEESPEEMEYEYLEVPDLRQIDPEQAAALAERFLKLKIPEERLSLGYDEEAEFLAAFLVENPDLALVPYSGLVTGDSAAAVWEVYETKIPGRLEQAQETNADSWLDAYGEVLAQRLLTTEDPAPILAALQERQPEDPAADAWYPSEIDYALIRAKRRDLLFQWYQALSKDLPNAVDWDDFVDLGAEVGQAEAVLEEMRSQLAAGADDTTLDGETRSELLAALANAALAADEVEAGLDYLTRGIELAKTELATLDPEKKSDAEAIRNQRRDLMQRGRTLISLGEVLDREDLVQTGADLQRALYEEIFSAPQTDERYAYSSFEQQAATFYREQDGAEAAETFLLSRIGPALEAAEAQRKERSYPGNNPWRHLSGLQSQFAELYAEADRHADLIRVFREGPFWESSSFAKTIDRESELVLSLVQALEATGEKPLAERILVALLNAGELTNEDEAYATLSRLQSGEALIATLDQLFANDAFQERPLIWKGRALLDLGRLDAAEEALKKAISIDPSDGEQGKGDRMRVYAVMSDLHAARGSLDEAKFFAEVVKSIRLSEDADDVYASGLKSRGIAQYEEALTHFADAYCIQSRMAVQLTKLGRFEEAEAFYRKAFELMPDSFGRMESHCFGCEGAFTGERAQQIAEQVFTSLIQQRPEKPQVRYLLGYLRDSQDRDEEALTRYQEAVELDPDYLNAWKKILSKTQGEPDQAEWHQRALLALARLDPYGRHTSLSTREVFDLTALYEALPKDAGSSAIPGDLFPLAGTEAFLDQLATYQFETTREAYPTMTKEAITARLMPDSDVASAPFEKIVRDHQFLSSWWTTFSALKRANF